MVKKLLVLVFSVLVLNSSTFADEYRQVPQGGGRMGTVLVRTSRPPEVPIERASDSKPERRLKTVARWAGTHFIGIVYVSAD